MACKKNKKGAAGEIIEKAIIRDAKALDATYTVGDLLDDKPILDLENSAVAGYYSETCHVTSVHPYCK